MNATTNTALRPLELTVWDQATIDRLKELDNKWSRSIHLWFAWVKEGDIIDFFVDYIDSFNEVERKFSEVPRKRRLEEIPIEIKMLFVEKGMMCMEPDKMAK